MKTINDTAGHLVGDEALVILGKVLRHVIRGNDVVGRIGGDEFSIILPQTPLEGAVRVGERIGEMLKEKSVVGPKGNLGVRVSIGVCTLEKNTFSGEQLVRPVTTAYFNTMYQKIIQATDEALYRSKQNGGNQICVGGITSWETDEPSSE